MICISHCKDLIQYIMSSKQFNKHKTLINELTCNLAGNPNVQKLSQILGVSSVKFLRVSPGRGKSTGSRASSAPMTEPSDRRAANPQISLVENSPGCVLIGGDLVRNV